MIFLNSKTLHLFRVLKPGEAALKPDEVALLDRINEAYYLPDWCSIADYQTLAEGLGLTDIKTADWSNEVAPFWGAVIKSALTSEGISGLLKAGWTTIKVQTLLLTLLLALHHHPNHTPPSLIYLEPITLNLQSGNSKL